MAYRAKGSGYADSNHRFWARLHKNPLVPKIIAGLAAILLGSQAEQMGGLWGKAGESGMSTSGLGVGFVRMAANAALFARCGLERRLNAVAATLAPGGDAFFAGDRDAQKFLVHLELGLAELAVLEGKRQLGAACLL